MALPRMSYYGSPAKAEDFVSEQERYAQYFEEELKEDSSPLLPFALALPHHNCAVIILGRPPSACGTG
jgi:hypothetical protein